MSRLQDITNPDEAEKLAEALMDELDMADAPAALRGHVSRYGFQKTSGTTQVVIDLHPGQEVDVALLFGAPSPDAPVEVAIARLREDRDAGS